MIIRKISIVILIVSLASPMTHAQDPATIAALVPVVIEAAKTGLSLAQKLVGKFSEFLDTSREARPLRAPGTEKRVAMVKRVFTTPDAAAKASCNKTWCNPMYGLLHIKGLKRSILNILPKDYLLYPQNQTDNAKLERIAASGKKQDITDLEYIADNDRFKNANAMRDYQFEPFGQLHVVIKGGPGADGVTRSLSFDNLPGGNFAVDTSVIEDLSTMLLEAKDAEDIINILDKVDPESGRKYSSFVKGKWFALTTSERVANPAEVLVQLQDWIANKALFIAAAATQKEADKRRKEEIANTTIKDMVEDVDKMSKSATDIYVKVKEMKAKEKEEQEKKEKEEKDKKDEEAKKREEEARDRARGEEKRD